MPEKSVRPAPGLVPSTLPSQHRWHQGHHEAVAPGIALSDRGERILRLTSTTRRWFGFLCRHWRHLFDDTFQAEMEATYRRSGQREEAHPPAMMGMALLLQA